MSKLKNVYYKLGEILLQVAQDVSVTDIRRTDDKELLYMHSSVHGIWNKISNNERVEGWDKTKLRRIHSDIVKEIIKRELRHNYISDLDDTLPSNLKDATIKPNNVSRY
jgi:chaperonin cofactor prefoldin